MKVPSIEPRTIMDVVESGVSAYRGKNRRMMWLVLAAIGRAGGRSSRSDVWDSLLNSDGSELLDGSGEATAAERDWLGENPKQAERLLYGARLHLLEHEFIESVGNDWKVTPIGAVISSEAELHFLARDEPVAAMEATPWQAQLIERMLAMTPDGFEHFIGKLLTKAGVFDVKVTGHTRDEGIDGHGSTVNGPLSVPVFFQAKRYQGSVSSGVVRDFRGSVQGRGHLGMIFTTGTFTKDAVQEAERTQAVNIQLFDGVRMAEWLKDLKMGVTVEHRMVEDVSVDDEWWEGLADDGA